jgi:hypothetical protein
VAAGRQPAAKRERQGLQWLDCAVVLSSDEIRYFSLSMAVDENSTRRTGYMNLECKPVRGCASDGQGRNC